MMIWEADRWKLRSVGDLKCVRMAENKGEAWYVGTRGKWVRLR